MLRHRIHTALFFTLLFYSLAIVIGELFSHFKPTPVNQNQVEKVVHQKLYRLKTTIEELAPFLQNQDDFDHILPDIVSKISKQNRVSVAIYRNWNLRIWPDERIALPEVYNPDIFYLPFIKLGNAFYLIQKKRFQNIDIVALSLVKEQYAFESELLKDNFDKEFGLQGNIRITNDLYSNYRIYDPEGKFLFSLEETFPHDAPWRIIVVLFLFFSFIIGLYLLFDGLTEYFVQKFGYSIGIAIVWALWFSIRAIFFFRGIPEILHQHDLFNPENFASGIVSGSLGQSTLTILWMFIFSLLIYGQRPTNQSNNKEIRYWQITLLVLIAYSSLIALHETIFIRDLVMNSSIVLEMYKVSDLSPYSFLAVLLILLYTAAYVLLVDFSYRHFKQYIHTGKILLLHIFMLAMLFIPVQFLQPTPYTPLFYFIFLAVSLLGNLKNNLTRYGLAIMIAGTTSLFFISQASHYSDKKWIETRKVYAYRIAYGEDIKTEIELREISKNIASDTTLIRLLKENNGDYVRASTHVNEKYFTQFFRTFNTSLKFFRSGDSLYVDTSVRQWQPWKTHYNLLLSRWGTKIDGTDYHKLTHEAGYLRYIGIQTILPNPTDSVFLVVEIETKPQDLGQGIHSYILKERFGFVDKNPELSYAVYFHNTIISKKGKYDYKRWLSAIFQASPGTVKTFSDGTYRHLILPHSNEQQIIVSEPLPGFYDYIIWFSYVFVLYYIVITLVSLILARGLLQHPFTSSLRNRIQFYMTFGLLFAIIIIGSGSIYFNFRSSKQKYFDTIDDKINAVRTELGRYFNKLKNLHKYDDSYMHFLLQHYSMVFNLDITLFDAAGSMISTSRRELFEEELLGSKMNFQAYKLLSQQKVGKIILHEKIGNLTFYSAYIPITNVEGQTIGFLNLPFFTHDRAFASELTQAVVALVNISVLMILISVIISFIISRMITEPLNVLRKSLSSFDISKKNTPIDYHRNDEIGELVKEYNRKVEELDEKTKLLAQSERQTAWQTMARQVAHEIKNPLTPMKLNVQLLQKSWEDNAPDFDSRLNKVCRTLIEQIETLSKIATEFSNFAQMPVENIEILNLEEIIKSTINLFEDPRNVQFRFENQCPYPVKIRGDRNQMMRVFTNLLKNAVQAIPEERLGWIEIKLSPDSNFVVCSITDNGDGIPEEMQARIFQPNFTTKTSGMGLGLAIVKNIVNSMSGAVWFETEPAQGTTFFIRLPLVRE